MEASTSSGARPAAAAKALSPWMQPSLSADFERGLAKLEKAINGDESSDDGGVDQAAIDLYKLHIERQQAEIRALRQEVTAAKKSKQHKEDIRAIKSEVASLRAGLQRAEEHCEGEQRRAEKMAVCIDDLQQELQTKKISLEECDRLLKKERAWRRAALACLRTEVMMAKVAAVGDSQTNAVKRGRPSTGSSSDSATRPRSAPYRADDYVTI